MALSNLTAKDLVTISSNLLSYGQLYSETEKQISTIGSRMTFKDRLDTMFDNIMSTVGENIANNAGLYTTWMITDLVEKATGGISIPTIIGKDGIVSTLTPTLTEEEQKLLVASANAMKEVINQVNCK